MFGLCVVVSLNTLQLSSSSLSSIQRPYGDVCWVVQELMENSIICQCFTQGTLLVGGTTAQERTGRQGYIMVDWST